MVILGIALCSILANQRMKKDIFPNLGTPVLYVAQPYGGMDPAQMEGYLVNYYEYHFLYVRGIEHVESRSIQGAALMKLYFHEGTDMAQAMAETVAQVNRSRSFMPPGTVPPFVMRFDAGSVPVGYLVFSSETRSVDEIADLALFRVRPMFSRLPGVSAPPPFGGRARSLVVHVDPDRLRAYNMSPDEVVQSIAASNTLTPSGNVRIGDVNHIAPLNSTVRQATDLNDIPLRIGAGPTVYLRDIGRAEDSGDILTSYALVNGRRAVYIAATKRADASTLAVVQSVKDALPTFAAAVPDDINIAFEFDQSHNVTNALSALTTEGLLGALLTGLMILVALGSFRSAIVVVLTIPLALLSALVALWAAGQTINLMTLGGLTLSIGILVDESVIAIENIHSHLGRGKPAARAVLEASREVAVARLLAMLCVVSVFAPSFFMEGVAQTLFVPLALAVGFAMVASYFLASTFVPILETWLNRKREVSGEEKRSWFDPLRDAYAGVSGGLVKLRWPILLLYIISNGAIFYFVGQTLGREIFPQVETGEIQMRLRAPSGTRVEETERVVQRILGSVNDEFGEGTIETSLGFIGVQPSSFPVNTIFLWTSGPHEAVMKVKLAAGANSVEVKDRLRQRIPELAPGTDVTFEAPDLVSQVMSFGAPTPVQIAVTSTNLAENRKYAESLVEQLKGIASLRDVQLGELLDYPTVQINVDRERAAQLGVTMRDVGRALAPATWSSRFTTPVYWADPNSGIAYQVQVEIPQSQMQSLEDVANLPVKFGGAGATLVGDVADITKGSAAGEYHRYNMQRMVTVTANIEGEDLGTAGQKIRDVIAGMPEPARGVSVTVRGQLAPLEALEANLQLGLTLAVIAVFILLAAYFQSMRVALAVVLAVPSVLAGVALALWLTGTTVNIQSAMGAIMAIGVSMADSIMLCTFAERYRREGREAAAAAVEASRNRVRPILMTSIVMIAGMMPLALGADQTAPLGIAVIGGLIASTLTALVVVPSVFSILQRRAGREEASIDPNDPESPHFDGARPAQA
jgi:multidrug efflux pump subunit AcrB